MRQPVSIAVSLIISLAAIALMGCSSRHSQLDSMVKRLTVPETTLLAITNGESFEAITNTMGIAARHEFTVAEANGSYTLISCYFAGGDNALWLVFHDKTLLKIIEPFSFPELLETYPYQGTTATRIKSWNIDDPGINDRVKKIIGAPALTHEKIAAELRPDAYTTSGSSWSIIPAFLLSGTLAKMAPQIEKDYAINESLLESYDGCSANIGMDTNEIEKLYGKPLRSFSTKNGETARIYGFGGNRELQVNPQLAFTGMAVVTDTNGHVTAVYSHAFFNDEWKR